MNSAGVLRVSQPSGRGFRTKSARTRASERQRRHDARQAVLAARKEPQR